MSTQASVEAASLRDLATLVQSSHDARIPMIVIGGYAVRAYTRGYRYTKDIDVVVEQPKMGPFIGLLKALKYATKETDFGLAASRRVEDDRVDIHISFGKVYDISSKRTFVLDPDFFETGAMMEIGAKFDENQGFNTKAKVVEVNRLVVLKLIPRGRPEKDGVDVASLFLDRSGDLDSDEIATVAGNCAVIDHVLDRATQFASMIQNKELGTVWAKVTGVKLTDKESKTILQTIRSIVKSIKESS